MSKGTGGGITALLRVSLAEFEVVVVLVSGALLQADTIAKQAISSKNFFITIVLGVRLYKSINNSDTINFKRGFDL